MMNVVILGAGLAGLECGRQLHHRGQEFLILEQDAGIGGLAKTNRTGDHYWDFGVHAMYSSDPKMTEYFQSLPLDYQPSRRKVVIVHAGHRPEPYLIDYPFEEGIRGLPPRERWECIAGYLWARARGRKTFLHLQDWIDHGLGYGIARHFMTPYNRKIWNCDLSDVGMDLVSAKIHPASVKNFLLAALGKEVVGRAYQAQFLYPRRGIQALADDRAREIQGRILTDCRIVRLDRISDGWRVQAHDGREFRARRIISTIPLADLLTMIQVDGLEPSYPELKWNDTCFVMVGLKPDRTFGRINDCHWVFFKEDEIFYRITMMHNFSREFLPAVVAEVTRKGPAAAMTPEQVQERVLADLLRLKIIADEKDVAVSDVRLVHATYPIPVVGLQALKERITSRLRQEDLYLVGRNGHWDYLNMDGVIRTAGTFITETFDG